MRLMATIVSGSVSHSEALQLGMYEVNGYHGVRQC